jgi:hypothetical protein
MNETKVSVVPSPYVRPPVNVTNIQIRVMNLILFQSVAVNVVLMSDNTFIESKNYVLEGTNYTSWMNDDTYIVDYVLAQLGLTQSPPAVTVS